jgi:hypothetical protein
MLSPGKLQYYSFPTMKIFRIFSMLHAPPFYIYIRKCNELHQQNETELHSFVYQQPKQGSQNKTSNFGFLVSMINRLSAVLSSFYRRKTSNFAI